MYYSGHKTGQDRRTKDAGQDAWTVSSRAMKRQGSSLTLHYYQWFSHLDMQSTGYLFKTLFSKCLHREHLETFVYFSCCERSARRPFRVLGAKCWQKVWRAESQLPASCVFNSCCPNPHVSFSAEPVFLVGSSHKLATTLAPQSTDQAVLGEGRGGMAVTWMRKKWPEKKFALLKIRSLYKQIDFF